MILPAGCGSCCTFSFVNASDVVLVSGVLVVGRLLHSPQAAGAAAHSWPVNPPRMQAGMPADSAAEVTP